MKMKMKKTKETPKRGKRPQKVEFRHVKGTDMDATIKHQKKMPLEKEYVSERVYEGVKPVSDSLLKIAKDNHERTHGSDEYETRYKDLEIPDFLKREKE